MGLLKEDILHLKKDLDHIHDDIEHVERDLDVQCHECKGFQDLKTHLDDFDAHVHDLLQHIGHIEIEHIHTHQE